VKKRSDNPVDRVPGPVSPFIAVWLAFLAPPIAALAHLQASFVLQHIACLTHSSIAVHAVSLALFFVAIAGGVVARRAWSKKSSSDARRLLALLGMIGAIMSGLLILAQWYPAFVLEACTRT
jgi:hypothetical protein